jgi:hypothetical protein
MEEDQAVAAAYAEGKKRHTDKELIELHKKGEISDRQFVKYLNWNKTAEREETEQIKRQETLRRQQRNNDLEIFEATQMYNSDGSPKALTQADAARICTEASEKFFKNDPHGLTDFFKRVNVQVEKIVRKNSFAQSDEGKAILKYINDKDLSAFYWDPVDWWDKKDKRDAAFLLSQKLQLLSIAEAEFKRNGGDVEKTINALDARLKDLNDGKITSILEGYNNNTERVGKHEQPIENPKRNIVRERFGKDKNGRKYKETIEYVE